MSQLRGLLHSRHVVRLLATVAALLLFGVGVTYAALPGGKGLPEGTAVPNPGTQAQELGNITFPAPFNVFEFPVTCGACHSGTVDQQVGHYGNWAGSNMASSARDPIFRANAIIINETVRSLTGEDGGANICFRCHSPNGWLSGRFDPALAGQGDGRTMIHSVLASTDDEGIMCETCHRAIGGVEMKQIGGLTATAPATQANVDQIQSLMASDPAFNMMAGFKDWPHQGLPYPNGPQTGDPLGDATLQYNDGMTYGGKYAGSVQVYYSDVPLIENGQLLYTGQTYGIYPPGYPSASKAPVPAGAPQFNSVGQEIVYNPDGSVPIHFEVPIAPPSNPDGTPNYSQQSISLEHPTFKNDFVRSSEFCGTCHDLTIPVLNHGMPEQRTYTEWKYSAYGPGGASNQTCQSCHAGTLRHEYSDTATAALNADPTLVGWAPYGKDRNPNGGTTVHKLAGANRDLPAMMKVLYPEVDLEIIGAPTGRDTRIFPGLMSSRDLSYDRTIRNTEAQMRNALNVEIVSGPTQVNGRWQVQVRVTNTSGHRIPTGYPDGRRFWLELDVRDAAGNVVYQSGAYDQASATLSTDAATPFRRSLDNTIDGASNEVMVYEKVTATCARDANGVITSCAPSVSLLNDVVIFDNRIPPAGYNRQEYFDSGTRFYTYNPTSFVPVLDTNRYADGQNYDLVTYTFDAPAGAQLSARAEVYWQTHTREHMEHLRTSDNSTLRPEGPPSIYEPNYPLTPNYLSDVVVNYVNDNNALPNDITAFSQITALDGTPLRDNWGGIAYAAWLLTGKGDPFQVDAFDTAQAAAPAAPGNVTATPFDPFAIDVSWNQVANADGYYVWIRYGRDTTTNNGNLGTTASWDILKVYYPTAAERASNARLTFRNDGLNVGKTYQYRVEAFNGRGVSAAPAIVRATTPSDLPVPPEQLTFVSSTGTSITLSWFDMADNEDGFIIERQDVPVTGDFVEVARILSPRAGTPTGGVQWTDTNGLQAGRTYNYQVRAYNGVGVSTPSLPIQAQTGGAPTGPITLAYTFLPGPQVSLVWTAAGGTVDGYRVERAPGTTTTFTTIATVASNVTSYIDTTVAGNTTYTYRITAFNAAGSVSSTPITLTTPPTPPAIPTGFQIQQPPSIPVILTWTYTWPNGTPAATSGFIIERAPDPNGGQPVFAEIGRAVRNARQYNDGAVAPRTSYLYRIRAYQIVGSGAGAVEAVSLPTNAITVVTPGEIPQAPSNLTVTATTRNTVSLRWRDNSTNEENFAIWRTTIVNGTPGTFQLITYVAANSVTYTDQNLIRGTNYAYYVTAVNRNGSSAPSETVITRTR